MPEYQDEVTTYASRFFISSSDTPSAAGVPASISPSCYRNKKITVSSHIKKFDKVIEVQKEPDLC